MSNLVIPAVDWHPPANGLGRFLLLDGGQCRSPEDVLEGIAGTRSGVRLFEGRLADGSADTSVHLIKLPEQVDLTDKLQRVDQSLKSSGAITFIDTSLETGELLQRLLRRLDAKFPNGKEFLVRFFDGRVLPFLFDVFNIEQRNTFDAIGDRWWFVGPDITWRSIRLTAPDLDPHVGPLQFSDEQRRQLVNDAYPYALIDHFSFTDQELLDRVALEDRYQFFKQCFRLAGQYGVRDGKRVVMFCTWALLLGEEFHLELAWKLRLEDFAAGRRTARDIGNEVWPVEESWE